MFVMTLKKKIIFGALGTVLVLGGYWYYRRHTVPENVPTETVRRMDVAETVSVSGELVPQTYQDLAFARAGVVESIAVSEGASVTSGKELARLDQRVIESQIRESEAALAIAEANERLARRNWDTLKPEERAAKKLATEQARENVRTLAAERDQDRLWAPFAGRVSRLDIRVGEVAPLGTSAIRIVSGDTFVIETRVPESDIAKVALGMGAAVTFDALRADEVFRARVDKIDPAATVVQDVVSYTVTLSLERGDVRLREGMTANVDIETAKSAGVLAVPFRAIAREGGRSFVEVRRGENQFEKIEVVIGLEGDDGTVEIRSGLHEGDQVTIGARQAK